MRRLVALAGALAILAAAWPVATATLAWVHRDRVQAARTLRAAEGARAAGASAALQASIRGGDLDRESLRALELLLARPERRALLPHLLDDLERFGGRLPAQLVVEWAGPEDRPELAPPEALVDLAAAVRFSRDFPPEPDGAGLVGLGIRWLVLTLLLVAGARALRAGEGPGRGLGVGFGLAGLVAVTGTLALLAGQRDGSLAASLLPVEALGLGLEWPLLGLAASAGWSHWQALDRSPRITPRSLALGLGVGALLAGWGALVLQVADWRPGVALRAGAALREAYGLAAPGPWTSVAAGLRAAVREELLFRLLLLGGLLRLHRDRSPDAGPGPALLVSALVWAGLHLGLVEPDWVKLAQVLPAGLVLGWLQLRLGLGAALAAHATWNTIGALGAGLV